MGIRGEKSEGRRQNNDGRKSGFEKEREWMETHYVETSYIASLYIFFYSRNLRNEYL